MLNEGLMIKNGDLIDEKYRIISEVGRGGMAVVYLAQDEKLQRKVALKALPPSLAHDSGCVESFINEAKKAAALSHPNIVTIYTVDTLQSGLPYFTIEFLKDSLHSKFKDSNMNLPEKMKAISEVLKGLAYAHGKGFVHRDIKPENIMFNESGEAVIIDFGIAKAAISSRTMTGEGMTRGTPRYMSPEQCKGKKLDQRSDLYSLGIVLYEAIAGHVPFDAEETTALMYLHVHEPPALDELHSAGIQESLINVIKKSLAKEPDERFQTALEFLGALNDEPAIAAPVDKSRKSGAARAIFTMALLCLAGVIFYVGYKNYYLKPTAAVPESKKIHAETVPVNSSPTTPAVKAGQPSMSSIEKRTTDSISVNPFGTAGNSESSVMAAVVPQQPVRSEKELFDDAKKRIRELISSGKISDMENFIRETAGSKNEYGNTPYERAFFDDSKEPLMMLAVRSVSIEMLDKLIKDSLQVCDMTGADISVRAVNMCDRSKNTPLMLAASEGREIFVEKLTQAGAEAGPENTAGLTAADLAMKNGHNRIAAYLKVWERNQALFKAIYKADANAVVRAVGAGADVNAIWYIPVYASEGEYPGTPLHAALEYHIVNIEEMSRIIRFLIDKGADKNKKTGRLKSVCEIVQNYIGGDDIKKLFLDGPAPKKTAVAAPDQPAILKYQTAVDGLRIRKEPDTAVDNVVAVLDEGEIVYYSGRKTDFTNIIELRGVKINAPWFYVRTRSGKEGWIFSGGLK
jgi:serine/threonine protein kinase